MSLDEYRLNRSFVDVSSLDADDAREFWRAQTPEQRLQALEFLRQVFYGCDPAATGLQRVIEVAELRPG